MPAPGTGNGDTPTDRPHTHPHHGTGSSGTSEQHGGDQRFPHNHRQRPAPVTPGTGSPTPPLPRSVTPITPPCVGTSGSGSAQQPRKLRSSSKPGPPRRARGLRNHRQPLKARAAPAGRAGRTAAPHEAQPVLGRPARSPGHHGSTRRSPPVPAAAAPRTERPPPATPPLTSGPRPSTAASPRPRHVTREPAGHRKAAPEPERKGRIRSTVDQSASESLVPPLRSGPMSARGGGV